MMTANHRMDLMTKARLIPTIAFALAALLAASTGRAADIANGKQIAQRWCAACHVVAPEQTRGSTEVPSFAAVAVKYAEAKKLANFLASPYPRMPNMALSQPEIADLVGYILSLGPPRDAPAPQDKDDKPPEPHRG
jgi:mono/diheme cytochrome c family protein